MKQFLLALAFLASSSTVWAQEVIPVELVDSVVRVQRPDGWNRRGQPMAMIGSGVIVGQSEKSYFVLSNHHVTGGKQSRFEFFNFGRLAAVESKKPSASWCVNGFRANKDLSLTEIRKDAIRGPMPIVPLAPPGYKVKPGDTVFTVGCSSGRWPRLRIGHVVDVDGGRLAYVPKAHPGDSGGPVYSADGRYVVALTAWSDNDYGYAMTSGRIEEILTGRDVAPKPSSFDSVDAKACPFTTIQDRCPGGRCPRPKEPERQNLSLGEPLSNLKTYPRPRTARGSSTCSGGLTIASTAKRKRKAALSSTYNNDDWNLNGNGERCGKSKDATPRKNDGNDGRSESYV